MTTKPNLGVLSALARSRWLVLAAVLLAAGTTAAVWAKPVTYATLPDKSAFQQASAAGYAKADALCATCHSRDYVTTQPPHKGKDFWTAEVIKMVNVYGAPIPEEDRAAIAEYLAATY
jgi:mono/diheme cytochrome c family protein